jgi:hypothetical protein
LLGYARNRSQAALALRLGEKLSDEARRELGYPEVGQDYTQVSDLFKRFLKEKYGAENWGERYIGEAEIENILRRHGERAKDVFSGFVRRFNVEQFKDSEGEVVFISWIRRRSRSRRGESHELEDSSEARTMFRRVYLPVWRSDDGWTYAYLLKRRLLAYY